MVNDEYSARPSRVWWWAAAVLVLLIAVAITAVPALRHWRERPAPPPPPVRATWTAPPALNVGAGADYPFGLALSPDGRQVIYPAARDGRIELWLQHLVSGDAAPVPNTAGAVLPFWSPDGDRIGYFADGALNLLALDGGAVTRLADVERPRGAAWSRAAGIVFTNDAGGLTRLADVNAGPASAAPLSMLNAGAGEIAHLYPAFLDGGTHLVCFVEAGPAARQGLYLMAIADGEMTRLTGSAASAVTGRSELIFAIDGALVRQTVDVATARLTGRAEVLGVRVGHSPSGQLLAAAAADVLIFSEPVSVQHELVWLSRSGSRLGTVGFPGDYWAARIAADGRRVAATVLEPLLRTLDVVSFDGRTLMPTRISLSIDADDWPAWSPDGLRIAWVQSGRSVMIRGAGAVLPAETLRRFDEPVRVTGWTPDGSAIIVVRSMPGSREDVWLVPVREGAEPRPLVATPFADVQAAIAPDGRRIAYASDESGRFDVYVETMADRSTEAGRRERVSSGGGSEPRWGRDGRELFFRRGSEIHVATPSLGRGAQAEAATSMLFRTEPAPRTFDVAPDGRLLLVLPMTTPAPPATLIVNWAQPKVTTTGP